MTAKKHVRAIASEVYPYLRYQVTLTTMKRLARGILDSDDPAVHAAMLDALTRAGVLTERTTVRRIPCGCRVPFGSYSSCCFGGFTAEQAETRLVTAWEAT